MLLPKHKIIFSLEQVISLIKNAENYSISKFSYIPDQYTFFCHHYHKQLLSYTITLAINRKKIIYVKIVLDNSEIKIDNSEFTKLFDEIYQEATKSISRIENQKFLKVFPDYNITEDRNSKISSLIELVDVSPQPKRKKFLGLF